MLVVAIFCKSARMTKHMGRHWSQVMSRGVVGPYSIGPKIGIMYTSYAHAREVPACICFDVVLA